jgi:predicted nucleic acid-binding protein
MIILDTSVWIEFLRGMPPYSQKVAELLESQDVMALECVFGELLQGTKNDRERTIVLSYWHQLPKPDPSGSIIEAGLYSSADRSTDKGVGLIDATILVQAIGSGSRIWTLDEKLRKAIPEENSYSGQA